MSKKLLALTFASLFTLGHANMYEMGYGCENMAEHHKHRHAAKGFDKMAFGGGAKMQGILSIDESYLTPEQKAKMDSLKKEMFSQTKTFLKQANKTRAYFSENSFDKKAFIEDRKRVSDALIDIKADYLEKIYNVLTDEQKKNNLYLFDKKD